MATALLIRHGRTTANASGTLAGWTPDVHLDELGLDQVSALGSRIATVPIAAVVTSPLDRCRETADRRSSAIARYRCTATARSAEVRYGDWTGEPLKTLAKDRLWKVVQQHPSNAQFPGDDAESLADMQARAVGRSGGGTRDSVTTPCMRWSRTETSSRQILADALGLHLDLFQRIVVDPASLSVVQYSDTRPFVERMNDSGETSRVCVPASGGASLDSPETLRSVEAPAPNQSRRRKR